MPFRPASAALSRFTVLDLTRVRSGPTCVRQLADWGANVVKIEEPAAMQVGEVFGPTPEDEAVDDKKQHVERILWCIEQNQRVTSVLTSPTVLSRLRFYVGTTPQAVSDEFYSRGTGGVAPQSQAE